jgi:hypothetical protein
MNREPKSRKSREFQSTNEAQTTGRVVCAHWADSVGLCAPGVGFSRFNGGPGSRFIGGLPPCSACEINETSARGRRRRL